MSTIIKCDVEKTWINLLIIAKNGFWEAVAGLNVKWEKCPNKDLKLNGASPMKPNQRTKSQDNINKK